MHRVAEDGAYARQKTDSLYRDHPQRVVGRGGAVFCRMSDPSDPPVCAFGAGGGCQVV
jgi:hypothetical protein